MISQEVSLIQNTTVTENELANAKDFVKSGLFLSMENMEAIMTRIARNEMYFDKYIPLAEVIDSIDRVTGEDILRLSSKVLGRQELTITGLGPFEKAGIGWKS